MPEIDTLREMQTVMRYALETFDSRLGLLAKTDEVDTDPKSLMWLKLNVDSDEKPVFQDEDRYVGALAYGVIASIANGSPRQSGAGIPTAETLYGTDHFGEDLREISQRVIKLNDLRDLLKIPCESLTEYQANVLRQNFTYIFSGPGSLTENFLRFCAEMHVKVYDQTVYPILRQYIPRD